MTDLIQNSSCPWFRTYLKTGGTTCQESADDNVPELRIDKISDKNLELISIV